MQDKLCFVDAGCDVLRTCRPTSPSLWKHKFSQVLISFSVDNVILLYAIKCHNHPYSWPVSYVMYVIDPQQKPSPYSLQRSLLLLYCSHNAYFFVENSQIVVSNCWEIPGKVRHWYNQTPNKSRAYKRDFSWIVFCSLNIGRPILVATFKLSYHLYFCRSCSLWFIFCFAIIVVAALILVIMSVLF